ncbi:MAG: MFS transporter [Gammaproteobacteria bacterium]
MRAGNATAAPRARLSGFYFLYFASVGAFLPFWGLYLEALAFTPTQIGELMAVTLGTRIVAPVLWGWLADHTGRRVRVIRVASLLATVIFSATLVVTGYGWMMLVLAAFSFFWNATLPQFEATTLDHLGDGIHHYSRIRLWGSIGFIVAVVALGPALDRYGIAWLPVVALALLAGVWLNTLLIGEHRDLPHQPVASLRNALRQPGVIALLFACFLLQASHGPYYAFYSIYMENFGYTHSAIGWLWALGSMAEVGVFMMMSVWLPRFGARRLLLIAIALAALRWTMIATLAESLPAMLIAQSLHAASFGVYHAAAIHMIYERFPGRLQGRGQALYSSLSFGLGGALGSLMSGYVWSAASPQWAFGGAALLAGAGALVVWRGVESDCQPQAARNNAL